HADAPVEIRKGRPLGRDGDLNGLAAAVLPRHAAIIAGSEDGGAGHFCSIIVYSLSPAGTERQWKPFRLFRALPSILSSWHRLFGGIDPSHRRQGRRAMRRPCSTDVR